MVLAAEFRHSQIFFIPVIPWDAQGGISGNAIRRAP